MKGSDSDGEGCARAIALIAVALVGMGASIAGGVLIAILITMWM